MFNKMKKFFARVALAALALQLVTMVLPVQAAYADSAPAVSTDKTTLYQDENLGVNVTLNHAGDYSTFFVTADGTNFQFIGSYKDGSTDDQDGLVNGNFAASLAYSDFAPTLSYNTHVYETATALTAVSDLTSLPYGSLATPVAVELGFRAPIATVAPTNINQATTSDLTVKMTTPGNFLTFYGTNDGTNYNFIGSYQDGGADDLDASVNGVFTQQYNFSYFGGTAGDYRFHVYESDAPKLATDSLLGLSFGQYELDVVEDLTAPTILRVIDNPATVNGNTKTETLDFVADEAFTLSDIALAKDGTALACDPSKLTVSTISDTVKEVTIDSSCIPRGKYDLTVSYIATDMVGNASSVAPDPELTTTVSVDTEFPTAVTGFAATVNDQGNVVLTWTSPAAGTFDGLKVLRDGAFLTTLGTSATTFTDTTTVRGQTYSYTVVAYDNAGNESTVAPIQVSVPSDHIAAAVSDSSSYSTGSVSSTGTVSPTPTPTVKSASKNDDNEFPWWGILILVILAGVGAWLIYSQKPAPMAAPVVPPVGAAPKKGAPRKTTTKK